LLGHNGAGKSTLFNMLTGIIGPSEGYAKIAGLDIRSD
jgi:ABC-type multidrug transport system ATPase subunit